MNIFQLVNMNIDDRKKFYSSSSDEELLSIYNQLPKYIEHPNFAKVNVELELIYNLTLKPLRID